MKFAIITQIRHKEHNKSYYSYEPYIREMNIWLKYVKKVEIVAPAALSKFRDLKKESLSGEDYQHSNLIFTTIPSFDILSITSTFASLFKIPWIFFRILNSMQRANHIHLRCPGNIGLIACFIQILFPKKPKTVKYAGNWDPNSKQPRSYRLQKWILSNTFLSRNIRVLVYGDWPNQSKNIIPFFTASFSEREKGLRNKDFSSPFKFIFVGSLSAGKRPLLAIKLIEALMGKGIPVKLEIYGSGVLKNELQEYIAAKNLDSFVRLMGNLKLVELKEVYEVSHFLVLASQSEGWPKAVAEAMFFGCIPVATAISCVPWMLGDGYRGILAPHTPVLQAGRAEGGATNNVWIEDLVNRIIELIKDPEEMKRKSLSAQEWSQEYTLEKFEEGIKEVLYQGVPEIAVNKKRMD